MDTTIELKASERLLDLGVAVPILTPRFLRKRRKPRRITLYTPTYGSLLRISRLYLRMGITAAQVRDCNREENLRLMAVHGKTVSRIVAHALVRGWFWGRLLNGAVAWWLRWRVHPLMLQEAWFQMMNLLPIDPFWNIIRSAEKVNLMKPRLSRGNENRS